MPGRHIILRGSRYCYVCRVPNDLLSHFPTPIIWKSLNTVDKKNARILAAALEYKTQQLFMQIRSGMLDPHLIDHLIYLYLKAGIDVLESKAYCRVYKPGDIETVLSLEMKYPCATPTDLEGTPNLSSYRAKLIRDRLSEKFHDIYEEYTDQLIKIAKKKYGAKPTAADKKELGMRVLDCEQQLNVTDGAVEQGDYAPLHRLKEKIESSKPYYDLATVINKYKDWYISGRPNLKIGTKKDMEVECSTLLDVFENISIYTFNSMDSITKLKNVLKRYPLNRVQRFGHIDQRNIYSILKTEKDYDIISLKTANEYIKRAKAIVAFAIKDDLIDKANKWENETFNTTLAEEAKRQAYDQDDIARLIVALCTQDLWRHNPPKPERFWLVLIALFHGLRLSNITGLNKSDICLTHSDIWVFRIRFGKSKSTVKDYPIHDCLLLLGFLEWVEKLDRLRLFQDSSKQISIWWNRAEKDKEGNVKSCGFEYSYITTDPSKCLYSLRHHYAGEVFNASQDYKATAEALGHSLSGKVTNGYIGPIRLKAHKELTDKLQFSVDLDRLELRAQGLFNINN